MPLIETDAEISRVLGYTKRIAVLGMKTDPGQPAFYVPAYAQRTGHEIIPVPVYYPELTEMMGRPVFRRIADIPGPLDMVDVFRRPKDIPAHVGDILAKMPRCVWFQLGIRNDEVAETLSKAGIDVVQDKCLMVEMQNLRG